MFRRNLAVLVLIPFALGQQCSTPSGSGPSTESIQVTLATNKGNIVIELFTQQTTAATNFKTYLDAGYYDDAVFSEVKGGKWLIGGRYNHLLAAQDAQPLMNDSDNGLTNFRGRVALYGPDGAASGAPQLLINLGTNSSLDYKGSPVDYTVIGRVVEGMEVADAIAAMSTITKTAGNGVSLTYLPKTPVSMNSASMNYSDYAGTSADSPSGENRDPVADAGDARYVAPGISASLDGSESADPDLDTLTYSWTQTAGTSVVLSSTTAAQAVFEVPNAAGDLTFQLTVDDGNGATDSATVTLTVVTAPYVKLETTLGDVRMEILLDDAPITSVNFLQYVDDGFYNGTIMHRVMEGFVVQGGGYLADLTAQTGVRSAIENEFSDSRSNVRGTVAMAKVSGNEDSATSQFFFNLVDNSSNLDNQNGGFSVFARVADMTVVDAMAAVAVGNEQGPSGSTFENVPVTDIVVNKATIVP
ncbi:MAG: peptidylprolyl isomerase [Phycisphaerae bacterium]|nr:peptidylprolyl isomerase [Phycisphaerae bacterium]